MFDDKTAPSAQPPVNLPVAADDMFAQVEKEADQPAAGGELSADAFKPQRADAIAAGVLKKKLPETAPSTASTAYRTPPVDAASSIGADVETPPHFPVKEPILGKVLAFIIGAVVLLALVFGGWWVYGTYFAKQPVAKPPRDNAIPSLPPADNEPVIAPLPAPSDDTSAVTSAALEPTTSSANGTVTNDAILFGEPIDSDKDGLHDSREEEIGTKPDASDSDADGLSDGDEVIIWKTNPLNPDTDNDTHEDGKEVRNGYNPLGPGKLFFVPPGAATTSAGLSVGQQTTTSSK